MKTVAILGPTASGKTALAIALAKRHNALILSLDSLSIYRYIDIASAKPSLPEREGITHLGIDVLFPDEHFDVTMFFGLYEEAKACAEAEGKNLIIVGGTSFYLKAMMEGLSLRPKISDSAQDEIQRLMCDIRLAYDLIRRTDPSYASKIASSDRYRIEKWLEIFIATAEIPSVYLERSKQQPLIKELDLFEIDVPREILAQKITLRTQTMIKLGLVDEVFGLEKRYGRDPQCMKAIGIKEVLDYFDGSLKYNDLVERISFNTVHLAKRQRTFNASQFPLHVKGDIEHLFDTITRYFTSETRSIVV
ncbi:MAG: tRNA (adenosine(37)-N6)-dimethylallyltransferase MiaA [Sulfurospirillum cavolei]|nr:tRNA (adenosine(37)-N6)-dimethylallyltransferase MiaA [Sulfurospirillum cavolei]